MKQKQSIIAFLLILVMLATIMPFRANAAGVTTDYVVDFMNAKVDQTNNYVGKCLLFVTTCWVEMGFPGSYGWGTAKNFADNNTVSTSKDNIPIGADVFFYDPNYPTGHIGIYVGDGYFVHAGNKSVYEKSNLFSNSYYSRYYIGWGWHPDVTVTTPVPQGSEMTSGYDRILPDGDYIIVNAGTKDKGSYYYLDAQGSKIPADNETNVHLWGPTTDITSYDVWTISYSNGFYSIKQKGTNMALDVYGASRSQGANVQVYSANSTSAQKWAISHNDRNGYRVQAKCSGMSLDVNGGGTVAGTNIQQWTNNDTDAQSWLFIPYNPAQPIDNGKYIISSALDSNKIVSTDLTEDIQNIFISSKGENIGDSVFEITKLDNGYYKVIHCSSGKALTVSGGFSTVNTNVALSINNNTIAKQWAIIAYNGKNIIISRCNGYALDITKSSTSDGTNIAMYRRHTNSNQQWSFEPAEVTVKFDANGGSSVSNVKVIYGNNISVLPQTSRNGYTFLGWYTSKTGGSKLTMSTKITSNVTYYAHWYNPCENDEHSWGSWTVTTPATCTANGEEIRVCARNASHIETRKIDALGHDYDNACDTTCNTCGYVRVAPHQYATIWSSDEIEHWHECELCGDKTDIADHDFGYDNICDTCGYAAYIPGDLDGSSAVTDADAVYLLMYTFFPDDYPISQPCDFDGDGTVTDADAVYLLMFTFFPEDYPIQ